VVEVRLIYEIYPRSFQYTDADGSASVAASSRACLTYRLGAMSIWICPIFPPHGRFRLRRPANVRRQSSPLSARLAGLSMCSREAASRRLEGVARSRSHHTSDGTPSVVLGEPQFPRQWQSATVYLWRDMPEPDGRCA